MDGIPDGDRIQDLDGIWDSDGIPDHNGIPDHDGIPDSDRIPDKGPHPEMGYQTGAHTPPILPLLQSGQTSHTPWLGCLIQCSFQSYLVWVQSYFTCSPPCENNIFHLTWKNSQNNHETTPFPPIRYLLGVTKYTPNINFPYYHPFPSNGCHPRWPKRLGDQEWSIEFPSTHNVILSFPSFSSFPRFISISPHAIISFTSRGKIPKTVVKQLRSIKKITLYKSPVTWFNPINSLICI